MTVTWKQAQAQELKWHRANPWRADTRRFVDETTALMRGWGFYPKDFKSVIDAGAGPRLRSAYFDAKLYAIEPLAKEYQKAFDWCDLQEAELFPVPLETFIPNLYAEFLMCLNCLDHAQDFEKCIENMAKYADILFLSFDSGETDSMHPLKLDQVFCEHAFDEFGLTVQRKEIKNGWRTDSALNYWLTK
jgi:hypothetical protein